MAEKLCLGNFKLRASALFFGLIYQQKLYVYLDNELDITYKLYNNDVTKGDTHDKLPAAPYP